MKNLQIIKQKSGTLSVSKDIATIRETFPSGAYLLSGDNNVGYDLDGIHKLQKGDNALIIISQGDDRKHSLVICSQGGFFDDQMVWSGEDIKSLQAAVKTLQNTKQNVIDQTLVECVEFTKTTLSNKAHMDAYLAKLPNAKVMNCTYNGGYAGTLHKINGSWYGVLVSESNTLAGQLSIKLQADGTIVEGTEKKNKAL